MMSENGRSSYSSQKSQDRKSLLTPPWYNDKMAEDVFGLIRYQLIKEGKLTSGHNNNYK